MRDYTALGRLLSVALVVAFVLVAGAANPADQVQSPDETKAKDDSAEKSALRTWTDRTGQFHTRAKYVGIEDGEVKLEKEDGAVVYVPFEKLSETDLQFLGVTQPPHELQSRVVALTPRQGVMGSMVNYYRPIQVPLSTKRPKGIESEPKYHSKEPLYGTLRLGTGPNNQIVLVVDEAEGETPRIYIDRNNDHDLTNDGSGEWTEITDSMLSLSNVVIDVPYGGTTIPYTLDFYRFRTRLKDCVLCYRNCCREGEITSRGKQYKIAVLNETADGRFDELGNGTLLIDLNRDGKLEGNSDSAEWHELSKPFNIHGKVWEVVSMSPDGTRLTIRTSKAKVAMKPYLNPGCPAPQFTGKGLDDDTIDLAENEAETRYILLDFWASWCGPCRGEFPCLRRVYARYKDHGLRIVGINLDQDRDAAVKAAKSGKLDYPHVFDGRGWGNAVALLYRVHGIPQTYLLDKDLKIVAVGLRGEMLERRLRELLGPGDKKAAKTAKKSSDNMGQTGEAID